jgi:hypothetical protein
MPDHARRRDKLIGLFALAAVLFNPPVLNLFGGATVLGWPLLYLYLFGAWGALVALLALVTEGRDRGSGRAEHDD